MKLIEIFIVLLIVLGFIILGSLQILILNKKSIYNKWGNKGKSNKLTAFDYATAFGGFWLLRDINYKTLLENNPGDLELRRGVKNVSIVKMVSITTTILFVIDAIILKILE
ncbi:hypothetical protein [Chitinophaga silvisoli]|uniref:Uncharacterized protein n=1 Tax=Chitinophaga silvisoli TaxID=2291814 RepID=A0A3E1NS67_9BACT|nr:hypothetical protein [Chitinophaga silvisoli]RFM30752.1 hypothetical protein DXN04_32065 [Chitinophaga silvisoli]